MLYTNTSFPLLAYSLFIILLHSGFSNSHTMNETDHLALLAFRDRITSDPLHVMSSWNDSSHFCLWQGITCGRIHPTRVTKLDLQSRRLAGSLPPHLGNLSFLRVLDLQQNSFSNHIPPEIGRLFRLSRLALDNNSFQGQLAGNISHCSNLIYLGLASNNLTGHIPPELGSLGKLQHLFFFGNSLTGSIPLSLGNLSSLQRLSASLNHFEGSIPTTLGELKSLSFLGFASNNLSGTIPPAIYNLSFMNVITLQDNHLDGTLHPDLFSFFPKLQNLYLYGNKFTGKIPTSLSNATNLIDLDMSINQFAGQVPSFSRMNDLAAVVIYNNNLGSASDHDLHFLSSLSNCSSLEVFLAMSNNFGGVLPRSFTNFSAKLSLFSLGVNRIHGTIPDEIGDLAGLTALDLQDNYFSGSIPTSLAKLQNLGELFLGVNQLTGTIPSSLGNLTSLTRLHLHQNSLEGQIPRSIGNLQRLELLALNMNKLNGTIPEQVVSLSMLSAYLDLSENQFTGSLPSQVGQLTMLTYLILFGNNLSGAIPSALGSCTSLIFLDLRNNLFQGAIPESLRSLRGIEHLDLSGNNLSGPIPEYLASFVFLKFLNLSYNDFQGEVVTDGVFSNVTGFSVQGNDRVCGGDLKLHLPMCSKVQNQKKHKLSAKLIIVISIASVLILLTSIALLSYFFSKKKKPKLDSAEESFLDGLMLRLSYDALLKATDGFSPTNLLGKGSFGSVYKGAFVFGENETVVAVKVIDLRSNGALKSFLAECQALRSIRHRNLVKILTACSSIDFHGDDFKALVYEYMPNGSLEEWLHPVCKPGMSLRERLDIAVDIACALRYLHCESQTPIVHCDLKPSNVLMDSAMTARLGDFGLARILQENTQSSSANRSSTLGLRGSIGYVAPEYGMGIEASTEGDVYSYGILLLEIFTGKKPTDDTFNDGLTLRKLASSALPGQVTEIVDPTMQALSGENEELRSCKREQCLAAVLGIGVACSAESPRERMVIADVVAQLHHIRNNLLESTRPCA